MAVEVKMFDQSLKTAQFGANDWPSNYNERFHSHAPTINNEKIIAKFRLVKRV
jgi:hypothetical protein